jgi:hypothetical protein
MNRDQVRSLFNNGNAHPHCPEGREHKIQNVGINVTNGVMTRGYVCLTCGVRYIARVDP